MHSWTDELGLREEDRHGRYKSGSEPHLMVFDAAGLDKITKVHLEGKICFRLSPGVQQHLKVEKRNKSRNQDRRKPVKK